ncbi:MAG: lysophospholipid acyltransferase family protein [Nitrospirota bacterium]
MTFLPRLYKLLNLFILNLLFLLLGIVVMAISPLSQRSAKIKAFCSMLWARVMCRTLGIHISIDGHHKDTIRGFTVCNHVSYLDIIVIGSIRPSVFISKHEVKDWPLLGWLARLGGTIFIDRKSKKAALAALAELEKMIDRNINIVLFPEGTTSDGYVLKEFKSTFFNLPVKARIPVILVSIKYTHISGKPIGQSEMDNIAWYGDMKLLPHVWNILGHRRIDVTLFFNPAIHELITGPDAAGARKLLSSLSYDSIKHGLSEIETNSVS